jgi:hypothetical protein
MIGVTIDLSGGAAVLALALSVYSTIKTVQFNKKQEALIKGQAALNALLIEREKAGADEGKRADLGADFVKLGPSGYRLKVFNKGRATARDVQVEFPEGNEMVSQSDVERKFPMATLAQHQSVNLIASIHMGSEPKLAVRLTWTDDTGADNSKTVHCTW